MNKKVKITYTGKYEIDSLFLAKYFKKRDALETAFRKRERQIEKRMQREFGIAELEFFYTTDGEFAGIGTPSCPEKMELVHVCFL
ncbi:MAG: hypothetical protein WC942_10630 [Clostridia bacterium]|jgi:hypothetical protein